MSRALAASPRRVPLIVAIALAAGACSTAGGRTDPTGSPATGPSGPSATVEPTGDPAPRGIKKIEHVIFVVQENRSFDHYFGTFPGAEGIPMKGGNPSVCAEDPVLGKCLPPFHDRTLVNQGGPHAKPQSDADVNGGKMDGFIRSLVEAIAVIKKDKEATFRAMAKWWGITDPRLREMIYEAAADKPSKPYPSVAGIRRVMEVYDSNEMRKYKPEDFYDDSFVRELDETGFIDGLYK